MRIWWKEWRQQRWFLWVACGAGLVFPLFELWSSWDSPHGVYVDSGSGVVVGFGALLAVVLAAATAQGDWRRGVREFWQSRPIGAGRLVVVKLIMQVVLMQLYLVVIRILLMAIILLLLVEIWH